MNSPQVKPRTSSRPNVFIRTVTLLTIIILLHLRHESVAQELSNASSPPSIETVQSEKTVMEISSRWKLQCDSASILRDSLLHITDRKTHQLQNQIDSLQSIGQPVENVRLRLDSVLQWKERKLSGITNKLDSLQAEASSRLDALSLPPEVQDEYVNVLSATRKTKSGIESIVNPALLHDQLTIPGGLNTSSVGNSSEAIHSVVGQSPVSAIEGIDQVQMPSNALTQLPTKPTESGVLIESQVSELPALEGVKDQLGSTDEIKSLTQSALDQDFAKQELLKQAKEQAIDHFSGQQKQLKDAMQEISKLKNKFSSLKSLSEIPKRQPNEMKGKPFIERVVPGVLMQTQSRDNNILCDFNAYAGYRLTHRQTLGFGWNHRFGYDKDARGPSPSRAQIFGPRIFGEYKLSRGFSPRVELEVMNTFIPPYITKASIDSRTRQWVWGAFIGIKKEYSLVKGVTGVAEVMFRLFDPDRTSPYGDVVNARFGIEVPIKKKSRAKE